MNCVYFVTDEFGVKAHLGVDGHLLVALVAGFGGADVALLALGALQHPTGLGGVLDRSARGAGVALGVVLAVALLARHRVADVTVPVAVARPARVVMVFRSSKIS